MVAFLSVIVSCIFLHVTQPFNSHTGWTSLSAASSHCHCPCCKDKECHCGMQKNQLASSDIKKSSEKAPCCAQNSHVPPANIDDHSFLVSKTQFRELNTGFACVFEYVTDQSEKNNGRQTQLRSAHSLSPPMLQGTIPLRI